MMPNPPFNQRLSAVDPDVSAAAVTAIGYVESVAAGTAAIRLDPAVLEALHTHADPTIAHCGTVGSQVKVNVGGKWLLASVREMAVDRGGGNSLIATIDFMGEGLGRADGSLCNFRRGVTLHPRAADPVFPVTHADVSEIFATDSRPHIAIGTVFPTAGVRAALYVDQFLGKHFAVVGTSGTGKSTTTSLILQAVVRQCPQAHVVIIDPHGEYETAFADHGVVFNTGNLDLPYWLMNFEEHCEAFLTSDGADREMDRDILARCLLEARLKSPLAPTLEAVTVDTPIPYLVSELLLALQNQAGRLEQGNNKNNFMRLKTKIEEINRDSRYSFMFNRALAVDSMAQFIGRILRMPGNGRPVSVIDLSGVPSDIISVVVAVLARIVFDYAIWSKQEQQRPILLVCEEAHHYIPTESRARGSAVRKILERIAKEGRKYGVGLGLISQRPSDLAEGALSQCGTIVSMRLNNARDQACVGNAMPEGGRGFLEAIPSLRNRECVICGEGVTVPVRVMLDELPPHLRPSSRDPSFSELWGQAGDQVQTVDRTIKRWRSQSRDAAPVSTGLLRVGKDR